MVAKFRWKSSDLALLPEDGRRYETVDGELFVTRVPHSRHQDVCGEVFYYLKAWLKQGVSGEASGEPSARGRDKVWLGPGVIFTDFDNVIPDVAWVSQQRLPIAQDKCGHLLEAPDLAIEVLSAGKKDIERDRNLKLRLYSVQGVKEYWLIDWRAEKVEIYRRESGQLSLQMSLFRGDFLTSPLLPEFSCLVDLLFEG